MLPLAACSSASDSVRVVDMLWVGTDADGALASGTLSAEVDLARGGSTVEVEVGGNLGVSGDVWNAAARQAVTTALLLGGVPPEGLRFEVAASDTIDGPSAGGLLAVAALADLLDAALLDGRSMTGTLQPNGSIGPVADIPEKLRAAQTAGITTVAVPSAMRTALDARTGDVVDVEVFARQLGVEVIFVSSVLDAADVLVEGWASLFGLPRQVSPSTSNIDVESSFTAVLDPLIARLRALDVAEGTYPGQLSRVERFRVRLDEAVESISSLNDPGSLRGHPVSLLALEREIRAWNAGIAALEAAAESVGSGEAHVRREAEAVRTAAAAALVEVASTPFEHVETFMALVDVAEWAADGVEVAHAVIATLERAPVSSQYLFEAAADLAEVVHDLEYVMPIALDVARRTGVIPMTDEALRRAEDLLVVLDLAIAANAQVINVTQAAEGFSLDTTNALAMIASWGVVDSVMARTGDSSTRLIASLADAVSRYVESSRIVTLNHLVSSQDSLLTDLVFSDLGAIREQFDVAHALSDVSRGALDRRGLDITYFSWERNWADAFSGVETDTTTVERLLDGLTRLWFDNVNQQLLVAMTSVR